jgi:two-component system, NtrC family, sensor kinase
MRVLMAEDDPVSRVMLQATLKKWGHEPVVARDGMEALAVYEQDSPPEIAILDWMMPEMDGPDVCRRIRAKIPTISVYIMLLTAKNRREDLIEGLAAGADDYVTKPFNHQEFLARLQVGIRIVDLQNRLSDRVRDLEVAMDRLRQMQQAQKLEALGRISSGIAHEINTPAQYLGENIRFIKNSWARLVPGLNLGDQAADYGYLSVEVPKAIDESLHGVERITTIVRAMRDFSQPSSENRVSMNVNAAIKTTLTIARSEWKYVAEVTEELDPELPQVMGFPGEIHQVLLNLIVNAAQAIAEANEATGSKGVIHVSTRVSGDSVEVSVRDTGNGISPENVERVFEPFFTTKDVGKGMGQGLSIAYSVVTQRHNGRIWLESEVGIGTTFHFSLPLIGSGSSEAQEDASVGKGQSC